MEILNLTNITIKERTTINGEPYFVIRDNNTEQAYFCFRNKLGEKWNYLVNNWANMKEVEIEFEENEKGNKVVSLHTEQENTIFV